MKNKVLFGVFIFATQACLAAGANNNSSAPTMECNVGPVTKIFGNSKWLTYSCSDGKSLVFVSAPGSRAFPFYFFFAQENGAYQLHGEGDGNRAATDAAYAQLKSLSEGQISGIVKETLAVSTQAKPK